ncbi:MAG TPA: histidine ammonia-lyase [Flavobacteriaceae bacterium]|nr:histidine ammonia-lyase [Flavobacteriaceae bacterium]MCB9213315.1 histidine ammonia-lyase [Alteromonas sp.]HPF10205.1 histidine ammonia-lyase [Flavobacteriaceae bacterium]HQU20651.1 histidine ammonia-lyase [Flavobacteriaceae bacterium]HQU64931.1 histidine ammonia-lyase [Flavobacteriaceae bacterium]
MEETHYISSDLLTLSTIKDIVETQKKLDLSEEAVLNIRKSHDYLQEKIKTNDTPIYGINTGFGSLYNVKIASENLAQLQENLVMSHACGAGDLVPKAIVKLMLLLKIQSLSYGYSGVQLETVQRLIDFYNHDIIPVVYDQGSLGASGDLAPLAHLSLPLLGKGTVLVGDQQLPAGKVLATHGWAPLILQAKEGLALLNGTQFMSAYGVYCLLQSYKLSYLSDLVASLSIDAFNCNMSPFNALVHMVRPHRGQVKTAERVLEFLKGSAIGASENKKVQDPYSFRCVPQVHGASKDTLYFVHKTIKTEINSVTDNPNIFVGEDRIISGGNFHGQPLALALDYLSIALAELGSISERRTYQLISGIRELPAFLVENPGVNSGFMIPQYTAASIVSQNKQLATPASVDSIVSSNGQEDHVSMGANAATKCLKVLNNLETILAIELMNASQALHFREPLKSSPFLETFVSQYRSEVPFVENDRVLATDIQNSVTFLRSFMIEGELIFE